MKTITAIILLIVFGSLAQAQGFDSTDTSSVNPSDTINANHSVHDSSDSTFAERLDSLQSLVKVLSDSIARGSEIQDKDLPSGARDTTSVNFKDTDLRDVFRALSFQHSLNIFLDNYVTKKVTIALTGVRVLDAIKFLCEQSSLVWKLDGGIFRITPIPPEPPAPPPPPKVIPVLYENGLLSIDVKNDDLERVILKIQEKSGKNILLLSGTTGTLTGKLMDIDFDIGFTQLLNNNGFAVQKKSNIYAVSRLDHFVGTQGATSAQRTGPYWISVHDSVVSIDVTNAPLDRVLADMIRQLNTDVVFYNTIAGNVTARATNVALSKALDLILRNTAYSYRESEGVYFVGEKTNKALVTTKLFKLKYLRAEKMVEALPQSITSQASVKAMKEHNGLVVIAANDVIDQMREYLNQIDKPVPQVLIEALVVDYDITRGSELGLTAGLGFQQDTTGLTRSGLLTPKIDYQTTGPAINNSLRGIGKVNIFGSPVDFAKLATLPDDFYLSIKALEEKGLANVRSRPLLATLNGHQASLSIGTTQYYLLKSTIPFRDQNEVRFQESQAFQTIEADVKLELTPYVGAGGYITVDIKPDFQSPVGSFSPDVPPTINKRTLSSTVVVREGETIILGGLISEGETEIRTQVPILGDIPLLGALFSSTSKTNRKSELVIYITPHISYGEPFQQAFINKEE